LVYKTLKSGIKWDDISSSIEAFVANINTWMASNMLKLIKDETEFIVFSSNQYVKKTESLQIKVDYFAQYSENREAGEF